MGNINGSKPGDFTIKGDGAVVVTGWFKYVLLASTLVGGLQVALENIAGIPFFGKTRPILLALGTVNLIALVLNGFIKLVQDTRQ